jgi:cytochrome c biogenesis protein CcmG, thiol:disulfide interchange protein DsbE
MNVETEQAPTVPPRKRRVWPALVVLGLAWIGVFFLQRDEHSSPLLGRQAPPMVITTFAGERVALADLRGQAVVVNFWASWCAPCRVEAPLMAQAAREQAGQVAYVGVNIMDTEEGARRFITEYGIDYPNGLDPNNYWARQFGVSGVPATFFIDADGVIREAALGPILSPTQLARHLAAVLPAATPSLTAQE